MRSKTLLADNPMILCACGCGQALKHYDAEGRSRRYLPFHFHGGGRKRGSICTIFVANETWTPIPAAPGYSASKDGHILGPMGKVLRPIEEADQHGYVFVRKRKRYVHRLILETFTGPCPNGMECRHWDGDPHNNRWENLLWGTPLENSADRRRHGRMPIPHESKFAKLKPADIPVIRQLSAGGAATRPIAARFGVSHSTIIKVLHGRTWRGY